jgi:hypothetical protein
MGTHLYKVIKADSFILMDFSLNRIISETAPFCIYKLQCYRVIE